MKFYIFKDEKLTMEVIDPKILHKNINYSHLTDYRVFEVETTVSNLQPSDNREDPEHKQFFANLKKKLCSLVESADGTKDDNKGAHGSAKKRRIERNPTLKIMLGVPDNAEDKQPIIELNGEFITALYEMGLSLPEAISVKLTLHTDLKSSPPDPVCKKRNFSLTTDELIIEKDDTTFCYDEFDLPDLVRNTIMNSKDGKKLTKIGGKFTIEISLDKFEESLVSPKTLIQTILNDAESADVVICTGDGKEIPCHRLFLGVNSVVLKTMLQSSFLESSGKIEMSDMSEEGVRAFLAFLYYRDLAPAKEKISIVWELLNASEKYNVIPLRTSMEQILLDKVNKDSWWTVETALQIFTFMGKIHSDLMGDVKKKIVQVMKRNRGKWMSSEVYRNIIKDNPAINTELLKVALSL